MPPNQEFYSHIEVNSVYAFKKWKNAEWNGGGRYWTKITTGNGISLFGLAKIDSHALGMGSIAFPIVLEQNMWVGLGEERQALFETNQKVFGFQNTLPNQLRAIGLNFDSGNIFGDFICASPHGPGISRFLIFTRFAQGVDEFRYRLKLLPSQRALSVEGLTAVFEKNLAGFRVKPLRLNSPSASPG